MDGETNIEITEAGIADLDLLCEIGAATFLESFGDQNTKSDMDDYLANYFSRARIQWELERSGSRFFIARFENKVIGYLKINTGSAQTEQALNRSLEIERIYVLSEFHHCRIGFKLLEKAVEIAKVEEYKMIWLGVWDQNTKAIAFYERNGFTAFGTHPFQLGEDLQTDILMKLDLE